MPEEASGTKYLSQNELNQKAMDYLIDEAPGVQASKHVKLRLMAQLTDKLGDPFVDTSFDGEEFLELGMIELTQLIVKGRLGATNYIDFNHYCFTDGAWRDVTGWHLRAQG